MENLSAKENRNDAETSKNWEEGEHKLRAV